MPETSPPTLDPGAVETSASHQPLEEFGQGRAAALFVYGTWAVMTASLFYLVARYAYNFPWQDEFVVMDVLTGHRPLTLQWLWAEHNEHRIPAVKLILLALYRWTEDFRSPLYLTVVVMSSLALGLIRAARTLRGGTNFTDAIFPLLLLHWGHAEIYLWGFQLQYVFSIVLTGIVLTLSVGRRDPMSLGSIVVAGTCLILLPLTGANGLIQVPALACWLLLLGAARSWSRGAAGRRNALIGLGFVAASLVITVGYFIGRQPIAVDLTPKWMPPRGVKVVLHSGLQFLTGGFGPAVSWYWPWSGLLTAAAFVGGGLVLLVRLGRGPSATRAQALGLLIFLGSVSCLVLALAWGRTFSGFLPPFMVIRYYSLATLAPCALYLVWAGLRSPGLRAGMQVAMFAAVCLMIPFNMQVGLDWSRAHARPLETIDRELKDGTTAAVLAEHHRPFLYNPLPDEWLAEQLQRLRDARVGPFRALQAPPAGLREVPIAIGSAELDRVRPLEPAGSRLTEGPNSWLRFRLPEARPVHAIRVKCVYDTTLTAPASFVMQWQKPAGGGPAARGGRFELGVGNAFGTLWPPGIEQVKSEPRTITVLIGETIDQFQFQPDQHACAFRLLEITMIVPESTSTGSPNLGQP